MQNTFSIRILFAVLTLIGFALLPLLSIRFLPSSKAYTLSVQYQWNNVSPALIEQEVTTPLEGAFNLVNGVKRIYSISKKGSGSIELELAKQVDLDFLRFEIATKIRQLYPKLPEGISYPTVSIHNPDEAMLERPILTYSLSGKADAIQLYRYAQETLSPQLALTDGIQQIQVQGGNEEEWQVTYNEELCKAFQISKIAIQQTIGEAFQTAALGTVESEGLSFFIRLGNHKALSPAKTLNYLQQFPIKKVGQRIVQLGDVATIRLVTRKPRAHYRINGQNSIRLLFFPEQQVNTIRLGAAIKEAVNHLATNLPPDYELFLDDDATEYLATELEKIGQRTFFSLGILLVFVLLFYQNFRSLLVIFLSLTANLGLAFIFYYWLEVELHLYALAGITVSFGIIIDNTLVMVHHLKHQDNLRIFPALLASTLTTLAALIIIFFLPEEWQLNLVEFAKVIGINLGVSLVVAAWLIPALVGSKPQISNSNTQVPNSNIQIPTFITQISNGTIKNQKFSNKRRLVTGLHFYKNTLIFLLNWRKLVVVLLILAFGLPVFMLPNRVENWDWYNDTLGSEWYIENVKPSVNKWLGGSLRLFVWYVYEGANYRQPEETVLYIQGSMPNGTTLEQMDAVYQQIERYLGQFEVEIKQYVTNVYSGQFAQTQIYFTKAYEATFPYQLKSQLIAFSINLGGVEWNVYGVGKGFSSSSASMPPRYQVEMYGYNKIALADQAQRFAQKLERHPRIKSVNTEANIEWWTKDLYEYQLQLDKNRLANQGLIPVQLATIFDDFNQSNYPFLYTADNKGIRLVNHHLENNDLWKLQNQSIAIESQLVNFANISTVTKQKVAGAIHKENQQYIQLLEWEYTGSGRFGDEYLALCQSEMEKELPLGYRMEESSRGFFQGETKKQYSLFLLIIGLIFFICAVQFESFRQAFAIILLIPISFIGIFITFYYFDFNFDQGGYTSFILLSGLVVNGLILIINDYNYYHKKYPNRSFISNYTKAFQQKITPVLLTIISTALGLLPFLWHGQQEVFWFSLAIGTIGGLLFSILVIVFFIPLFLTKK